MIDNGFRSVATPRRELVLVRGNGTAREAAHITVNDWPSHRRISYETGARRLLRDTGQAAKR